MLYPVLLTLAVFTGAYFAFRYILLVRALKAVTRDLYQIQEDLTQNQMLCLPMPNRQMGRLLVALNIALKAMQKERCACEKREKEFQVQIENISHDLRTPLTVILGYLILYKSYHYDQISNDAELAETIHIIEQNAEMMKDLVTQFYDYSRLQAEDYSLSLQKTDIARILRESLMGNCQILEQAHLRVNPALADHPIWGWADKPALERIFQNLFQNAGRYADTYLAISIQECGQEIFVTFTNDTRLLRQEDIPHLFERFYVQDNARNRGGTGLGLTVAKKLADQMEGKLDVKAEPEPETGLHQEESRMRVSFILRLPVSAPSSQALEV